ncbi:hypothetical protein LCGC14_1020560 [marine sediment metagenome]|uniref:Large polyvalent protein associated domain-containing protein n=1 Tax=marine sediment metagenome TaxID=412755 RepID=A0A0F9QFM3_9ZZZZ|nr:hypothetical protein [bacterium]
MGPVTKDYNFESYEPYEGKDYDFESYDEVLPTPPPPVAKGGPSALSAMGQTLKGMFYGEGLPEGIGYLQKPAEAVVDYMTSDKKRLGSLMTKEDEINFRGKYPNLMAARYALSSLIPGGQTLASPEEAEAFSKKPIESQRLDILGETAGWALGPVLVKGAGAVAKKALSKIPWFAKNWDRPIGTYFKKSKWFKNASNEERGAVMQLVYDKQKAGVSDAEIIGALNKQAVTPGETPINAVVKIKPIQPVEPKTLIAKEFQKSVLAEHTESPLAVLGKKETALAVTKKGEYDFEVGFEEKLALETTNDYDFEGTEPVALPEPGVQQLPPTIKQKPPGQPVSKPEILPEVQKGMDKKLSEPPENAIDARMKFVGQVRKRLGLSDEETQDLFLRKEFVKVLPQLDSAFKRGENIIDLANDFVEQHIAKKGGSTTLYGGVPIPAIAKLSKQLAAKYDSAIGEPVWKALSDDLPVWAGKKSQLIDKVNKGFIYDYRKDPAYIEIRDDAYFRIETAREKIKEVAQRMAEFSRPEQVRIAQIIEGSATTTPERYKDALWTAKEFQRLEGELQELEILGKDNRFRQLNRKEIAAKFKEIDGIDAKIAVLKKRLEPIVKTARTSRRVSEDITEEILSASEDVTEGVYEVNVTKWSELNEQRIMEALTSRGFTDGESTQMLNRVKESVMPLISQRGTLKEIRTKIEKVVTRTIIQETEKLKTYSPSMMARAKGSLIKDIGAETKKREEILNRIKLHYKMSGKQYLRRAYRSIEEEKKLSSNILRFLKGPRLNKEYAIRRKDLSYLYRKELGEIKEAPYLVYKGLSAETRDVELMRMFTKISENRDWAISPEEWANIQNIESRAHLLKKYESFKPLPKSDKLGPLSGALVDPYIWDDLNQAVKVEGDFIKAWDSVLRLWKTGKVVYNPATQVRNMLSNIVLADFSDLSPHRIDIYARAARDMLTKDGYWKEAKQTPLLGTEWAGTEIKRFLANAQELKSGNMLSKSAELIKGILDKPGKTYQGIEQFFKLAVFVNERVAGKSIKAAAAHAEKAIFNYQKIPPAIRQLKRWYSPFITFSYKAIPRFAETAIRKPWKIAKYALLMAGVEEITRRMNGESEEEVEREKRVLPDYMRKSLLPGQLSHLRIPIAKDEYGRSKYLDLSYIMPWGDIAEQWGQSRIVGRPLLPNHPFIIVPMEIGFNEILFTGEPLTLKSDEIPDYFKKIGTEIWRQAMPSLAGGYSFDKLMSAWNGERDWRHRERSIPEAVFDVFLGLKIRSIDYTEQLGLRLWELGREKEAVEKGFKDEYERLVFRLPGDNSKKIEQLFIDYNKKMDRFFEQAMDYSK